jgi:hypothetical protein
METDILDFVMVAGNEGANREVAGFCSPVMCTSQCQNTCKLGLGPGNVYHHPQGLWAYQGGVKLQYIHMFEATL